MECRNEDGAVFPWKQHVWSRLDGEMEFDAINDYDPTNCDLQMYDKHLLNLSKGRTTKITI